MPKIQNNIKECALAVAMGALVALGVIGGAGSINYGVLGEKGWLYVVSGLVAILDAAITGIAFYNKFLKPE